MGAIDQRTSGNLRLTVVHLRTAVSRLGPAFAADNGADSGADNGADNGAGIRGRQRADS